MNGKAVDTSVLVGLLRGEPRAEELLEAEPNIQVPVPVMGELLYGALRSHQGRKNIGEVHRLLTLYTVIPITADIAETYAKIREKLAVKGDPIPENDIWIAACALENRLPLMTFDRHFDRIEGLEVIS